MAKSRPETTDYNLLPCPFCGNEDVRMWEFQVDGPSWAAKVECQGCGASSDRAAADNQLGCFDAVNGVHMDKAASAWNRRA